MTSITSTSNAQYDNLVRYLQAKNNLPYTKYEKKSDNLKEPIILTESHLESLEKGLKYQELGKLDYKETFGNYTSFQRYLKEYEKIKSNPKYATLLSNSPKNEDNTEVQELTSKVNEIQGKLNEKEMLNVKLNAKIDELKGSIQDKDKIIQEMEQTQIESYFVEDTEKDQLIESLKNTAKLNDTVINNLKSYINEIKIDLIYFEQAYKYLQFQNQSKNLEEKLKHIPYFKTQLKNECEKSNVSYNELQQKYNI